MEMLLIVENGIHVRLLKIHVLVTGTHGVVGVMIQIVHHLQVLLVRQNVETYTINKKGFNPFLFVDYIVLK